MKQKLIHLPLEPYKARYTDQLHRWEKVAFEADFDVSQIQPSIGDSIIRNGEVLDSTNRPLYAMAQCAEVLSNPEYSVTKRKIFCSDFYTPGLDGLAYANREYSFYSFLWAQTFDRFDFTTRFGDWMRPWEVMAFNIYRHVFVASPVLHDLIVSALPDIAGRVHVVGLPFSTKDVLATFDASLLSDDTFDVVYTSRWDTEKNPMLFVNLVVSRPDLTFAVCTGHSKLRGSDYRAVAAIERLEQETKRVRIFRDCSKAQYYAVLARSKIQLNTAYQDWVSYTLLEALAYDCQPLYPNFRSFPHALNYSQDNLYRPADLDDLNRHLNILRDKSFFPYREEILALHDSALPTMSKIILNA